MAVSKFFKLPLFEVAQAVVPVNPDTGTLRLSRTMVDVMVGAVPGLSGVAINAFRATLAADTLTVVDEIARTLLTSSAGVAMTIRSTSASDVGPVVRVGPLGASYSALPAFNVTLNGTTPVSLLTATPLTRINFMGRVSGDFVGNVLIEASGVTYGVIAAGQQTMRSSQYTVPAGYRFFVLDSVSSITKDSGSATSERLMTELKPSASTGFGSLSSWSLRNDGAGSLDWHLSCPQGLTGPLDIRTTATMSTASADAQILLGGILQDLSVVQL